MKINYDKVADAIYFTLKKGKVVKTVPVNEHVNIDMDANGSTLGIELLEASSQQGPELQENIRNGVRIEINEQTPVMA